MTDFSQVSITPEEVIAHLRENIQLKDTYRQILSQQIIRQAAQARGLTVTEQEIQAEADKMRYAKRLEKASDTLAWLTEEMITPQDWEAGIRERLFAKKLADYLFDQEVEKQFAQHSLDFDRVLLYQIIVPYESLAQELFYQIEEEEISFYEAAHLYNIDEQRRQVCGYEGKIYRWNLKAEIAAVVFSAKPKEVTYPLKSEQGYHLFLIEEFIPAQLTPQRREEIIKQMFGEWLQSELNHLLHYQINQS